MSKGLEALESLMIDYYEMCQDLGNNDDQYQRCNLTSERAIIEEELKEYETLQDDFNKLYERTYKEHKALEIITRHLVIGFEEDNGIDLPTLIIGSRLSNGEMAIIYSTQDKNEIDILKEVLGNDNI